MQTSDLLGLTFGELINQIAGEEPKAFQGQFRSRRAALDVLLAKKLSEMIGDLCSATEKSAGSLRDEMSALKISLDNFKESMNKSGGKTIWLTAALFFVGFVQAIATVVPAWPTIVKLFR